MLSAITRPSAASSPSTRSAAGHDEQPWLVKSSTTAFDSAASAGVASTASSESNAENLRAIIAGEFLKLTPKSWPSRARRASHFTVKSGRLFVNAVSCGELAQDIVQDSAV